MEKTQIIPDSNPKLLKAILKEDFKGRQLAFYVQHETDTKFRITTDIDEAIRFYQLSGMIALRVADSEVDPGDRIFVKGDNGETIYYCEDSLIDWEYFFKKHLTNLNGQMN